MQNLLIKGERCQWWPTQRGAKAWVGVLTLTFISLGTLNFSVPNYRMGIIVSTLQAVVKIKFIYRHEVYSVVQNDLMTSSRYKTLRQKEWDGMYQVPKC